MMPHKRIVVRKMPPAQYFRIEYRARNELGKSETGSLSSTTRDLGDRIAGVTRRFEPGACTVRVVELTAERYAALVGMDQEDES